MSNIEKKERIENVAWKIKTLFIFSSDLIKDIDILEEFAESSWERMNDVLTAAPLIWACWWDYEEKHLERKIQHERGKALLNLVKTLKATEDERVEFKSSQGDKKELLNQLWF